MFEKTLFAQANEDYRNGNYKLALEKYKNAIKEYNDIYLYYENLSY